MSQKDRSGAMYDLLQLAAHQIRDGWHINVCVENGAAWIEIYDHFGEKVKLERSGDEDLLDELRNAVAFASPAELTPGFAGRGSVGTSAVGTETPLAVEPADQAGNDLLATEGAVIAGGSSDGLDGEAATGHVLIERHGAKKNDEVEVWVRGTLHARDSEHALTVHLDAIYLRDLIDVHGKDIPGGVMPLYAVSHLKSVTLSSGSTHFASLSLEARA